MIFNTAKMLIPNFNKTDKMQNWSVVACDQYTSQPNYWNRVKNRVDGFKSTYNLVLPEVYLEDADFEQRIIKINTEIEDYINSGVFFETEPCYIYVERTLSDGSVRHGLMGAVDLEEYNFNKGSKSKVRATEGTVIERIPPRLKVRQNALAEFSHIMMLIDDVKKEIIEPLADKKQSMEKLYDFELMENGGKIEGYILDAETEEFVKGKLKALDDIDAFNKKYGVSEENELVYAVGDGNHSLATAKTNYENYKKQVGDETAKASPARYALAELVNLHDDSLVFEAIHRVVFDVDENNFINELKKYYNVGETPDNADAQKIVLLTDGAEQTVYIQNPSYNLAVGSIQAFIDEYLTKFGGKVDYIHGADTVRELTVKGCVGIILDAMEKSSLYKTVIVDGSLPRKTFSMGEAYDKRYYLEGRKIK